MKKLTPGTSTGNNGGIFQEVGPKGGARPHFATVPEHTKLPPTTTPNATWKPIHTTPHGKK